MGCTSSAPVKTAKHNPDSHQKSDLKKDGKVLQKANVTPLQSNTLTSTKESASPTNLYEEKVRESFPDSSKSPYLTSGLADSTSLLVHVDQDKYNNLENENSQIITREGTSDIKNPKNSAANSDIEKKKSDNSSITGDVKKTSESSSCLLNNSESKGNNNLSESGDNLNHSSSSISENISKSSNEEDSTNNKTSDKTDSLKSKHSKKSSSKKIDKSIKALKKEELSSTTVSSNTEESNLKNDFSKIEDTTEKTGSVNENDLNPLISDLKSSEEQEHNSFKETLNEMNTSLESKSYQKENVNPDTNVPWDKDSNSEIDISNRGNLISQVASTSAIEKVLSDSETKTSEYSINNGKLAKNTKTDLHDELEFKDIIDSNPDTNENNKENIPVDNAASSENKTVSLPLKDEKTTKVLNEQNKAMDTESKMKVVVNKSSSISSIDSDFNKMDSLTEYQKKNKFIIPSKLIKLSFSQCDLPMELLQCSYDEKFDIRAAEKIICEISKELLELDFSQDPLDGRVFEIPPDHEKLELYEGATYIGELKNNKPEGIGKTCYESGNFHIGEYKFGKPNGYGIYESKRFVYKGLFADGKAHGFAVYTFDDGTKYCGYYKSDKREGYGHETQLDGLEYIGTFMNGKKHGVGILRAPNQEMYEGNFKKGKIEGIGKYTWQDGRIYIGAWKDNMQHGYAEFRWPNKQKYSGFYVMGKMEGHGVLELPNGCKYDGMWRKGFQHGIGKYWGSSRWYREVEFDNGKFVQWTSDPVSNNNSL